MEPLWVQGVTGCNSIVAIVDDGMYSSPSRFSINKRPLNLIIDYSI